MGRRLLAWLGLLSYDPDFDDIERRREDSWSVHPAPEDEGIPLRQPAWKVTFKGPNRSGEFTVRADNRHDAELLARDSLREGEELVQVDYVG